MTEAWDLPASRGGLRDEAADWFAVMRGPDAEARRGEFEAWLDAHAIHREAYNRIAETFSLGKALKGTGLDEQVSQPASPAGDGKAARMAWASALLLIAAVAAAMVWAVMRQTQAFAPATQVAAMGAPEQRLETQIGEIRQFRLADGSVATLDTDSVLLVSLRGGSRDLTLIKGRARFFVAHEKRPFLVTAGGGTVRAVGTVFDVNLGSGGRVDVRLLKGVVLVDVTGRAALGGQVRRLDPGQALAFGGTAAPALSSSGRPSDANWPSGLRDFDGVRVADVIQDANRYATIPLRAATADIGETRISGAFRIDDSAALAANIADVLGLAELADGREITLMRECPPEPQKNCKAPLIIQDRASLTPHPRHLRRMRQGGGDNEKGRS
ncbi:FecR domain-containing protein [Novosphingobium sp. G106]|uniref:FecR family protein n=1 Tax=Novosphingobium sp. G106 TaxID=2849500 RepID=UPI001C2CE412|nr:FecR domain-containing protein [Novosphingobium sp. G106]MBV1687712.1 FecR domain-containing protein [Novosphingobium sp. G106]